MRFSCNLLNQSWHGLVGAKYLVSVCIGFLVKGMNLISVYVISIFRLGIFVVLVIQNNLGRIGWGCHWTSVASLTSEMVELLPEWNTKVVLYEQPPPGGCSGI